MLDALAIDHRRRRVTVGGEAVELTATEYELLCTLALDAGRVVTCETLLRRVWNGHPQRQREPRAYRRQVSTVTEI